ncbi:putative ammonium transporter 1 [Hypomesus transpacificus]|uniref:putative ammonium transporter 1 n=1 Tax=Hypomesus transpacificus TaxID=137520 RepID=UPI001F080DB9|nr:putative ammonium transporter 1 [Hypomesus transpacificus]
MSDTFVTLVAWWLHGYAFAFGQNNSVIGAQFFLTLDNTNLVHFLFNYMRCSVATTLALGAANERMEPIGHLMSAYVFAGLVYPLACHWVWDEQGIFYSASTSYATQDYAGSGVIFLVGGAAAAVSLRVIGPRARRWSIHFRQRRHSPAILVLGGCLQLVGFLGLVLGSHPQLFNPDEGQMLGLCWLNLLLAASSGGLYCMVIHCIHFNYYDLDSLLYGAIAGMVSVCAGVDSYIPGVAVMAGTTGSLFYLAVRFLMAKIQMDDPLNIVSCYLAPGIWGLLHAGLLSENGALGGRSWMLGNNCLAVVVLVLWVVLIMYPLQSLFMCLGVFRVPRILEKQGIDRFRHRQRHPCVKRKFMK